MNRQDRPEKRVELPQYLEVHVEEDGSLVFSNLNKKTKTLVENITGKARGEEEFYCG